MKKLVKVPNLKSATKINLKPIKAAMMYTLSHSQRLESGVCRRNKNLLKT